MCCSIANSEWILPEVLCRIPSKLELGREFAIICISFTNEVIYTGKLCHSGYHWLVSLDATVVSAKVARGGGAGLCIYNVAV